MNINCNNENGVHVLSFKCDIIDFDNTEELKNNFDSLIPNGEASVKVLLDMNSVRNASSYGIKLFKHIHSKVEDLKGNLAFVNVNDKIKEIFYLTDLIRLFIMFDNKNDAIKYLKL